jgi:hypothetical protein
MKKYIYILSLFVFTSCNFINPFHDEGKSIETIIELDDFTQIEIHNSFDIEIIEDTESYILYIGGEKILDEMTYSSLSGILKLDYKFMNWTKDLKIPTLEIHMPLLEGISLYAPGSIKSLNQLSGDVLSIDIHESSKTYEVEFDIDYNNLRFQSRGSVGGTFNISGMCPKSSYVLNGSTNLKAYELDSKEVNVIHNSLGNAYVYTQNKLLVTFYKSGDIYYKGNPDVIDIKYDQINNQDASGKVIKE